MTALDEARARLAAATRIVTLTGAGVSAESGIPTFRGAGGLWRTHRPEDLATPQAFARDPALVWEWYDWRRGLIAAAAPNAAHHALAALEAGPRAFTLATQNVDGLHRRAGSRQLIELHGNLWIQRCTACGREREETRTPLPERPPRCACGGLERPGVVWFGESLPEAALEEARDAVAGAEVVIVVGTSAVVWPAAGLIEMALDRGVPVIEVNAEPTPYSGRTLFLEGLAGGILPALISPA